MQHLPLYMTARIKADNRDPAELFYAAWQAYVPLLDPAHEQALLDQLFPHFESTVYKGEVDYPEPEPIAGLTPEEAAYVAQFDDIGITEEPPYSRRRPEHKVYPSFSEICDERNLPISFASIYEARAILDESQPQLAHQPAPGLTEDETREFYMVSSMQEYLDILKSMARFSPEDGRRSTPDEVRNLFDSLYAIDIQHVLDQTVTSEDLAEHGIVLREIDPATMPYETRGEKESRDGLCRAAFLRMRGGMAIERDPNLTQDQYESQAVSMAAKQVHKWRFIMATANYIYDVGWSAQELETLSWMMAQLSTHERGAGSEYITNGDRLRHNPALHSLHMMGNICRAFDALDSQLYNEAAHTDDPERQAYLDDQRHACHTICRAILRVAPLHDMGEICGEMAVAGAWASLPAEQEALLRTVKDEFEKQIFYDELEYYMGGVVSRMSTEDGVLAYDRTADIFADEVMGHYWNLPTRFNYYTQQLDRQEIYMPDGSVFSFSNEALPIDTSEKKKRIDGAADVLSDDRSKRIEATYGFPVAGALVKEFEASERKDSLIGACIKVFDRVQTQQDFLRLPDQALVRDNPYIETHPAWHLNYTYEPLLKYVAPAVEALSQEEALLPEQRDACVAIGDAMLDHVSSFGVVKMAQFMSMIKEGKGKHASVAPLLIRTEKAVPHVSGEARIGNNPSLLELAREIERNAYDVFDTSEDISAKYRPEDATGVTDMRTILNAQHAGLQRAYTDYQQRTQ